VKTRRHFYLIFINYAVDKEPPETLDINKRYLHPLGVFGGTIDPAMINYRAASYASMYWLPSGSDGDTYRDLDFVAYMVTGAHTARLVWRKRAGNVRGKWAAWHGNPAHKRPMREGESQ